MRRRRDKTEARKGFVRKLCKEKGASRQLELLLGLGGVDEGRGCRGGVRVERLAVCVRPRRGGLHGRDEGARGDVARREGRRGARGGAVGVQADLGRRGDGARAEARRRPVVVRRRLAPAAAAAAAAAGRVRVERREDRDGRARAVVRARAAECTSWSCSQRLLLRALLELHLLLLRLQ